jgi:hypothetical protein
MYYERGEMNSYILLVGKPDGNRPLGRQRRRWMDNIKLNLGELRWVVWIGLFWLL